MTPLEEQLSRQLEECRQALADALRENELLRQKVDLLIKRIFGCSSQQIDRSQLELFLREPSTAPELPFKAQPPPAPIGKKSSPRERAASAA